MMKEMEKFNITATELNEAKLLASGEKKFEITETGEDGVRQIRALLGLQDMVTNVNLPNCGQIPNLPLGAVVETNAVFRADSVVPTLAGEIPAQICGLILPIVAEQELVVKAGISRDISLAFKAFVSDPLVTINSHDAKKLFDEMIDNYYYYLHLELQF